VSAHLGSRTTTTLTIDPIVSSALSFSSPSPPPPPPAASLSLCRISDMPIGIAHPRPCVMVVACARRETRASRRAGRGISRISSRRPASLREMSPIPLDYVVGFPLRLYRLRIISRGCPSLPSPSPVPSLCEKASAKGTLRASRLPTREVGASGRRGRGGRRGERG